MCGIAGKVILGTNRVTEKEVKLMTDSIKHRGPDDSGIFISSDGKVGLGHRRLSIIDLSPLGHQPMSYSNRYQIVFNGEIYNFQSHRDRLKKMGYKFKSQSDTEVILALFDKYGVKCLQYLRGMFAFAIYDSKKNILFCARDRVGKKPFKYFLGNGVFMFASELKAILTQKEYKREPDYLAIHHYLTYQYVPSPLTGFKDIYKLEPAHYLILDINSGKLKKERYWQIDYRNKLDLSEEEWCERIREKLEESVKLRMISDVPLGAFLSGGVDSSAVVAMMARNSSRPVKTFSIGFKEQKYNELPYAKVVAEKYKTDHTEFIVKPDAIEVLPMLVKHYEEPYADSSALPTYYVSKLTREHVTVALNGDGGDENFAGYGMYSVQKFSLWYDNFRFLNRYLAEPATELLLKKFKNKFLHRANRFARTMSQDYRHRYVNYICYFNNDMKRRLYRPDFMKKFSNCDSYDIYAQSFEQALARDRMDQTLYADLSHYLPDDLMAKVDIASMAVSLEGRSPFLDHEMVDLAASIPFNLKLRGRNNKKYILKKALEGIVPNEVMYRPKKGFGVPVDVWFRNELKSYTRDQILSKKSRISEFFNRNYIQELFDLHQSTEIDYAYPIWSLLTLELWFKEYFG